ncbi:MBOAT family O-acyltransferase [Costertonia aggregata]|uniref:MBOAT family protein n=1 Tax=Costertonia aggregata TaxID=343403 RepID=A0A7H9AT83_9FLAO|nr:MBOAT family protein [Costertonia aggregata]QLG46691.1 MBOAT family protein [Costertonia aggregata]
MVFNSFGFAFFMFCVFLLYWTLFKNKKKIQNLFILVTSLYFYALTDWRFLTLLVFCILTNYYVGLQIEKVKKEKSKQRFLYAGLVFNIGLLLYFKYLNFFISSFFSVLNLTETAQEYSSLHIIVPLGISFFTFQNIGYLLDVFNEQIKAEKNIVHFTIFTAYFPKILSGPIERAGSFLPQIKKERIFSDSVIIDGLRQILWGLFAKMVVAENCAGIVRPIFDNYTNEPWTMLLVGALFYTIQLYADFSGYSNMAIGVSKLLGIQLTKNFATPFFSTNIADFWRGWHISLTTWMMDYVFTPLSFTLRAHKKFGLVTAIVATFVLVGLWHGANWTFIVYGLLHGLYFIPIVYKGNLLGSANSKDKPARHVLLNGAKGVGLFLIVALTAVFFGSETITMGAHYIWNILSCKTGAYLFAPFGVNLGYMAVIISFFFFMEWINKNRKHDFEINYMPTLLRWAIYMFIFLLLLLFGKSSDSFIYFQF